jgi:3-deoxy-D-manno-octulosonic-acid transferase
LHITGNLKLSMQVDHDQITKGYLLKKQWNRPTFIAASTHPGEEEIILQLWSKIIKVIPNILFILAPRHPHRSTSVHHLCNRQGMNTLLYEQHHAINDSTNLLLVDKIGKLSKLFATSDVAFIGGSLVAIGGHNILEPIICGTPVITGPHYFNSPSINKIFLNKGGALLARNVTQMYTHVLKLITNIQYHNRVLNIGRQIINNNSGSLEKTLLLIEQCLDNKSHN